MAETRPDDGGPNGGLRSIADRHRLTILNMLVRAEGGPICVCEFTSALALSQQRKGDLAAARDTFQELLRSYPDAEISRGTYGPDAHGLFESVRRDLGKADAAGSS